MLISLVAQDANAVAYLQFAKHMTVALSLNDIICHWVAVVGRQHHDNRVGTALTSQTVDRTVALELKGRCVIIDLLRSVRAAGCQQQHGTQHRANHREQ